jgi:hypothetical protein
MVVPFLTPMGRQEWKWLQFGSQCMDEGSFRADPSCNQKNAKVISALF